MAEPELKPVEMAPADTTIASCQALNGILERVGDKWTIMIVGVLSNGATRFNAIQRAIPGLSHKMLTSTLRGLERDGLVTRTAFPTIPPRVDYTLTDAGRSLIEPLAALADWARSRQSSIANARQSFDARDSVK